MSEPSFDAFFQAATGGHAPYDYQCRLACGDRRDRSEAEWLDGGTACQSQLIHIPTGLGKTAAVVLGWLWNRLIVPQSELPTPHSPWPRWFVDCLPTAMLAISAVLAKVTL